MLEKIKEAAGFIRNQYGTLPEIGIVLGSGLGNFVKEIKTENRFENGLAPVDHLPDTNYWHYSLQLNTYRYILENYYGLRIEGMYLVVLHPDFPSFKRVEVARMDEEVEAMMATRRLAVEDGCRRTVILPAGGH